MLNSEHCCRNEEVLQLDDEFPVRLVTALGEEEGGGGKHPTHHHNNNNNNNNNNTNNLDIETVMSETK